MAKKDALEKTQPAGALARPDYAQGGDVRGMENVQREDLLIPYLGLAQGLSPQLIPGDPKHIPGLTIGDMFNTVTRENYGKGPMEFTVIRVEKTRAVEFYPIEEGGGIKDRDVPLTDPRCEFHGEEPPVATKFMEYVILILPRREMLMMSFKTTGINTARGFNSLLQGRKAATFAGKYTLSSMMTKNDKGTWAVLRIDNSTTQDEATHPNMPGWVHPNVYVTAAEAYDQIAGKSIVREDEPEQAAPSEVRAASEM